MRKLFDFHGGVHPIPHKRQSVSLPIATPGIPPRLILPLCQHIGAAATPLARVGERVLKGQLIAAANGDTSAALHAPTSGTIAAIEERVIAHPSGRAAPCMVLDTDGKEEWVALHAVARYAEHDPAELLRLVAQAGIVGLGGAGFPTAAKLSVAAQPLETLIINGAECEPYITCDDMLMRERARRVIDGVHILRHILAPRQTVIATEDNTPEALAALREAARDSDIEIIALPAKYPSGGERQLIEQITGRQVPSGALPASIGVLCCNVASAAAVFEAVAEGRPLISRITTVTGGAVREPRNYEVLLGTPIRFLLEQAGCDCAQEPPLIMGGSMMGFVVPSLDAPVMKTTNCLLAPGVAEMPPPAPAQPCIRCGLCAEVCPARLLPQQLFWFSRSHDVDKLEQHHLFDCIECGACAYVCPSSIPLVQYYRAAKGEILQQRSDRALADLARTRFEAHQRRMQRDELEKDAKRAARRALAAQRAAGDPAQADDPIQAAVARVNARKAALHSAGKDPHIEGMERTIATAHKRVASALASLELALAQGSDQAQALQQAVTRSQARLAAAQQALDDFRRSRSGDASFDAVRTQGHYTAMPAAGSGQAGSDPARANLERLALQLKHSEESLARCRSQGEQPKVLIALEATVARLRKQLQDAQQPAQSGSDD